MLPRHALVHATSRRRRHPAGRYRRGGARSTACGWAPIRCPCCTATRSQVGASSWPVVDERHAGAHPDGRRHRAPGGHRERRAAPRCRPGARPRGRLVSLSDGREYQLGHGFDGVRSRRRLRHRHRVHRGLPAPRDHRERAGWIRGRGHERQRRAGERGADRRRDASWPAATSCGSGRRSSGSTPRRRAAAAPAGPPPGAAHRLFDTVHGIPAMVPAFPVAADRACRRSPPCWCGPAGSAASACRSGRRWSTSGARTTTTWCFGEESVSASHAKLQRREERLGPDRPRLHQRHLRGRRAASTARCR